MLLFLRLKIQYYRLSAWHHGLGVSFWGKVSEGNWFFGIIAAPTVLIDLLSAVVRSWRCGISITECVERDLREAEKRAEKRKEKLHKERERMEEMSHKLDAILNR